MKGLRPGDRVTIDGEPGLVIAAEEREPERGVVTEGCTPRPIWYVLDEELWSTKSPSVTLLCEGTLRRVHVYSEKVGGDGLRRWLYRAGPSESDGIIVEVRVVEGGHGLTRPIVQRS